jgi:hypothetical protein
MEPRFGRDLSGVRIHTDTTAARAARMLSAEAFTVGQHIHFGENQYRPDTPSGRRLLAHELTHTIQQGSAAPNGGAVAASSTNVMHPRDPSEREAESVADRISTGAAVDAAAIGRAPSGIFRQPTPTTPSQINAKSGKKSVGALPTGTLLELSLARLNEIAGSGNIPGNLAARQVIDEIQTVLGSNAPEDATQLREKAVRLNDYLASNQSIFASLHPMEARENYLPGIADRVVMQVDAVAIKYAVALELAFRPDKDHEIFEMAARDADEALTALPDFIVNEYLGPDGIETQIAKVRPELLELDRLRMTVHRSPLRGRTAEKMVWMDGAWNTKDTVQKQLTSYLTFARTEKKAGHDIGYQLRRLQLLTQQALGVIHAMQIYEQIDAYVQALDTWINSAIEIVGTSIKDRIEGYRDQVGDIITLFEGDYDPNNQGRVGANSKTVADALNKLNTLVNSPTFQSDIGIAEDRMKTIAVIRIVGKVVALTALAALGGAVAAEYAGAAAVGLGAAEGGTVAGGAAFTADVLAFTAINRAGSKQLFGSVEGTFAGDFAINFLTFGLLKGAQAGFTRIFKVFADPKVWKISYALGKAGVGLITLQAFAEAQHALSSRGKLMDREEFIRSGVQNVVVLVALEAGRFITDPIAQRLSLPALRFKFQARMEALETSSAALKVRVDSLRRGEISPDQTGDLLKAIADQWFQELKLLDDAAGRKAISEAELNGMVAKYQQAIAEMQLRLARVNIDAPIAQGPAMFHPLANGVVAFRPEAEGILRDYYKQNGGKLESSKDLPDGYEGRLPTGDLTFYTPESLIPKELPDLARTATARDAATKARDEDPIAAEGFEKLSEMFNKFRVDEILASVPPESMSAFLRLLSDPSLSVWIGRSAARSDFYIQLAQSPSAIRFGRRRGFALMLNLVRRFRWTPELEKAFTGIDALAQADPAGTKSLLDSIRKADSSKRIDALLGKEKEIKPRRKPVRISKETLPVDRDSDAWETNRAEAERFAEGHGEHLTDEQLDLRSDALTFVEDVKIGKYKRHGRPSKLKLLDAFDAVAKQSGMQQTWINNYRGNIIAEALFIDPQYKQVKVRFLAGERVTGAKRVGETSPDYVIPHSGFSEYVNLKSDLIDQGDKDEVEGDHKDEAGAFKAGKKAAIAYRGKAGTAATPDNLAESGEATNLPAGDRYSLDFIRDPGAPTQRAMMRILFGEGSLIYRVRFGGGKWHANPNIK